MWRIIFCVTLCVFLAPATILASGYAQVVQDMIKETLDNNRGLETLRNNK